MLCFLHKKYKLSSDGKVAILGKVVQCVLLCTLIKNNIKFSSYIRKFRMERLQSHLWGSFRIYEEMRIYLTIMYLRRQLVVYDFATAPFWLSLYIYEENLIFFFISVRVHYSTYGMEFMQFQKSGRCHLSILSLHLSVKDKCGGERAVMLLVLPSILRTAAKCFKVGNSFTDTFLNVLPSNVKSTLIQDRLLSFSYKRSQKNRIYSLFKQNPLSNQNVLF